MIPPINSLGLFEITEEHKHLLSVNQKYKVISVRNISDLIRNNINVLKYIYLDNNLTEENYLEDKKNDIPIIGFLSESNAEINIPSNLITKIPTITGVEYQSKVLAMNLGILIKDINLKHLEDVLKKVVLEEIGVTPLIEIVPNSATIIKSKKDSEIIETKRKSSIPSFTLETKLKYTEDRLYECIKIRDKLIDIVKSNKE